MAKCLAIESCHLISPYVRCLCCVKQFASRFADANVRGSLTSLAASAPKESCQILSLILLSRNIFGNAIFEVPFRNFGGLVCRWIQQWTWKFSISNTLHSLRSLSFRSLLNHRGGEKVPSLNQCVFAFCGSLAVDEIGEIVAPDKSPALESSATFAVFGLQNLRLWNRWLDCRCFQR